MAYSTPKQQRQSNLRHAIRTVSGFNGYLNHLEYSIKQLQRPKLTPELTAAINALRAALPEQETQLRVEMNKINEWFD